MYIEVNEKETFMENDYTCLTVCYTMTSTYRVVFTGEELEIIKKFLEENPDMQLNESISELVMLGLIRNPYDGVEKDSFSVNIGITNAATGCEAELDEHTTAKCALEVLNSDWFKNRLFPHCVI